MRRDDDVLRFPKRGKRRTGSNPTHSHARYSDAPLKSYELIPVMTVVVTMMVVGVIGV